MLGMDREGDVRLFYNSAFNFRILSENHYQLSIIVMSLIAS